VFVLRTDIRAGIFTKENCAFESTKEIMLLTMCGWEFVAAFGALAANSHEGRIRAHVAPKHDAMPASRAKIASKHRRVADRHAFTGNDVL
jgi:hypothetical protein